jgi:putative ABC transport system ATP-binding protein
MNNVSDKLPAAGNPADLVIDVQGLTKVYAYDGVEVHALRGVSLAVPRGKFISIMGPSGCGKSTLLYCMAGMATATSGRLLIDGTDMNALSDSGRTDLRRRLLGFVFQRFNLMPTLTVAQNVALAVKLKTGRPADPARIATAIKRAGIDEWADTRPRHLSEGQKQRAAIARAIATEPAVLFADEPTGNLDSDNSAMIMDLFLALNRGGQTIIMVTHNPVLAEMTQRVYRMQDGMIV